MGRRVVMFLDEAVALAPTGSEVMYHHERDTFSITYQDGTRKGARVEFIRGEDEEYVRRKVSEMVEYLR